LPKSLTVWILPPSATSVTPLAVRIIAICLSVAGLCRHCADRRSLPSCQPTLRLVTRASLQSMRRARR
jgi:hypothetical protein